jgi:hypothetical protein
MWWVLRKSRKRKGDQGLWLLKIESLLLSLLWHPPSDPYRMTKREGDL